jgi:hypothetical protein
MEAVSSKDRFTLLLLILYALGAGRLAAQDQLLITEFMADNQATITDGYGRHADWIEIHNPTPSAVDLAGWQLRAGRDAWTFPARILPPGGYLVVFAAGQASGPAGDPLGYLQASFKLSAEGEPLDLVNPGGQTVFGFPWPVSRQREDISCGLLTEQRVLVDASSPARILVPDAPVSDAWRGGGPFDDAGWRAGSAAAGFNLDPGPVLGGAGATIAYRVAAGTAGTQNFGGALGMDWELKTPIIVTALGVFDDGANGLRTTLTAQLWRRDTRGTPTDFTDDTGAAMLAQMVFTASDPGALEGGSRFKTLATPVALAPGAYTIVAYGYNDAERNGNAGSGGNPEAWETGSGQGAVEFTGTSRYGTAGGFPRTVDGGPADRYAAGTFKFVRQVDPDLRTDLTSAMSGRRTTALLRIPFTVPPGAATQSLVLRVGYDDGFAAWINGLPVAQRNAPEPLRHDSAATRADNGVAQWNVVLPPGTLREGTNLLALQGLNVAAADRDFILAPSLSLIRIDPATVVYFRAPTPGGPNDTNRITAFAIEPAFSQTRGCYTAPFDVVLSSGTPGAAIRYTTDGSAPSPTRGQTYAAPLRLSATTILRALAFQEGMEPSTIVTHTYLFLSDVAIQTNRPPGYPTSWAGVTAAYGMPTNATAYARAAGNANFTPDQARAALVQSLQALPALCLATDRDNLFSATTGLYLNPGNRGEAWERPVSAELILPDGAEGFQANAGLQIMGWTSRSLSSTPKLNFRLLFERKYGPAQLRYPFFGPAGASKFNSIALRANSRDSWAAEYAGLGSATYLADQWAKQAQLEMGRLAPRGRFVHLYLNGLYWGIYNPTERPDAAFVASYLGGAREDYDVIKFCCPQMVEDGGAAAWNDLLQAANAGVTNLAAYQRLQGNRPDGTRDPAWPCLIDIDNFIDYVINGQFHASVDWPGNYYAGRNASDPLSGGFQFFQWDNDLAFSGADVNANKVQTDPGSAWWQTSPGALDIALRKNPEYRLRFADHVYRHFFNEGALTTRSNSARWTRLAELVEPALFAESARWGGVRGTLRTVQDHWRPRLQRMLNQYFPARNAVVLAQLRSYGLYPKLDAPEFVPGGGVVPPGQSLRCSAKAPIYLTLDGSDPRLAGGGINPAAQPLAASNSVVALPASPKPVLVRARAFNGTEWSALHEAQFLIGQPAKPGDLVVSEIAYHPAAPSPAEKAAGFSDADDFEFLELANTGTNHLALVGLRFTQGLEVDWSGPALPLLAPGECLLLVASEKAFLLRHGQDLAGRIAGTFTNGTHLSNAGDRLALVDAAGQTLFDFSYGDDGAWPTAADGSGATLVLVNPAAPADPANWRASLLPGGTPGTAASLREEWRRLHFAGMDPARAGDLADPDGDGAANLLEYALGTDPNQPNPASAGFQAGFVLENNNGQYNRYLALTLHRIKDPTIGIALETSSDLVAWREATAQFDLVRPPADPNSAWETVLFRAPLPWPANHEPAFWRLRITTR